MTIEQAKKLKIGALVCFENLENPFNKGRNIGVVTGEARKRSKGAWIVPVYWPGAANPGTDNMFLPAIRTLVVEND